MTLIFLSAIPRSSHKSKPCSNPCRTKEDSMPFYLELLITAFMWKGQLFKSLMLGSPTSLIMLSRINLKVWNFYILKSLSQLSTRWGKVVLITSLEIKKFLLSQKKLSLISMLLLLIHFRLLGRKIRLVPSLKLFQSIRNLKM